RIRHYFPTQRIAPYYILFFFNDTATTDIYTLSLHDALPIWKRGDATHLRHHRSERGHRFRRRLGREKGRIAQILAAHAVDTARGDRKSTRLNSSHRTISYAVFCLKKKKKKKTHNKKTKRQIT